jgi:trk system potassium uptake protein TrkH
MLLYLCVAGLLSLGLMITETGMPAAKNPHLAMGLVFEAVSALGTVGLSTGVTPHLSTAGKTLLIIAMFIGRVGPLTFFLAIGGKPRRSPVRLIEENVGLG